MLTAANSVPSARKSREPIAANPRPVSPTNVAVAVAGSTVNRSGAPAPVPAYIVPVVGSTASAGTTPMPSGPTTVPAPVRRSILSSLPLLASVP